MEYIELNRTFQKIELNNSDTDEEVSFARAYFGESDDLKWPDLVEQFRVVLLSEAGAGKTTEVRQAAKRLIEKGKAAFFMRLEHVSENFEDAFEEGTLEEFQAWQASSNEGWLFLDSVDEARLANPKAFHLALKIISKHVSGALNRLHVTISSRVEAWRPQTDLAACQEYFPTSQPDDEHQNQNKPAKKDNIFFVRLADLVSSQIDVFLASKKVNDIGAFLDEVERRDAWMYTTRPQDLEELIESWQSKGKIGTRWEWMDFSITRRLQERDPDREGVRPFTLEKARAGAKLLATATTLMKQSAISAPEGSYQGRGLSAKRILKTWDNLSIETLLSRPIFDESVYGCVQFHHRSAKEFLAAEYLADLLSHNTSRRAIEGLFFHKIYDTEVIDENFRSVLCWMVHMDQKIREKAVSIEPEIILEGGDPSRLPIEEREEILKSVCLRLHQRESRRTSTEFGIAQRFASPDLSNVTLDLINTYADDSEVMWFLFRLVWHGKMQQLRNKAIEIAKKTSLDETARVSVIRALSEIGLEADFHDLLDFYRKHEVGIERRVLSSLVEYVPPSEKAIELVVSAIENADSYNQYSVTGLSEAIKRFIEKCQTDELPLFLEKVYPLLKREPFYERREMRISTEFGWLTNATARVLERLINERHKAIFSKESLDCLLVFPEAYHCHSIVRGSDKLDLSSLVQGWPELNKALFWLQVNNIRKYMEEKERPLTEYYQTTFRERFWAFGEDDFEWSLGEIGNHVSHDDNLIALTLAIELYVTARRPRKWREQLKKKVANHDTLRDRLNLFLHPPKLTEESKRIRRQHYLWKEVNRKRKIKDDLAEQNWKEFLSKNVDVVRKVDFLNPHLFLYDRIAELDDDQQHRRRNYKILIPEYGQDVASAYRDSVTRFWKTYTPKLHSETGDTRSTPYRLMYGLSGISILASENVDWYKSLSINEVDIAARYAIRELNEFPHWFDNFYQHHKEKVSEIIIQELLWEITVADDKEKDTHYMLSRISWGYRWMCDDISLPILDALKKKNIQNIQNLEYALTIVNGSTLISDSDLETLATNHVQTSSNEDQLIRWLAVWTGVNPTSSITFLENHLSSLSEKDAVNFSMKYLVNLLGGRRHTASIRKHFECLSHLKVLYLLLRRYVRPSEDLDRIGQGVYSPGLRDDAQDARNLLFKKITEIPGKETYVTLLEFSDIYSDPPSNEVMCFNAFNRAVKDASASPWSEKQILEFIENIEITPKNHKELYGLACRKLLNLKYDLEEGDTSIASILQNVDKETEIRNYIAGYLRDNAQNQYVISQEDELADAKRPDIRFFGIGFDAPVPVELKLAENWSGTDIVERFENQLCGDYLRDIRSSRGIFLLVYGGGRVRWEVSPSVAISDFDALISYIKTYWHSISHQFVNVDQVEVIGIDLTQREK